MIRLFLIAALLFLCGSIPPADAAQVVLCASARAQGNSSASQIGIPNLSQTYTADPQGCVVANGLADIATLRAQGYTEPGKERTLLLNTGVATGTTSYLVGSVPAGAYIQQIIYANTTANPAGNISFGTTSGGADVVAAAACGANCLTRVTDAQMLKSVFSTTATQPIFVTSSAWGSASLTVTLVFGWF
jgi:glycerol-3-phosphate acyltransferase PlsY